MRTGAFLGMSEAGACSRNPERSEGPQARTGGEGGIRTPDTGFGPYNGLANSARPLPIARNQSHTIGLHANSRAGSGCSAALYAPQYAPPPTGLTQRADNWRTRLISRPVDELRPHPSYACHKLSVDALRLSALAERGDLAFCDPIVITHDRIVIDGYARWELAKRTGRQFLDCIEHELSLEEALAELIRIHCALPGLTDFVRIELALDMEPYFQQKALVNQQAGGQSKGSSKLTIDQRVDTRREVARVAGVSSGNVRKVKHILAHACSNLLQSARAEEVSINLADKWSHESHAQQQEYLRLVRIERGIKRKARNLVTAYAARLSSSTRDRQVIKLPDLVGLLNDTGSIEVEIVDAPGRTIFVTKELIHSLTPRQGVLVS